MQGPPVPPDEPLLPRALYRRMGLMIPVIAACTLGWFMARTAAGVPFALVRTETFTLLVICEWFNVLNCRSATRSALNLSLLKNPWLLGGLALGNALHVAVIYWPPFNALFHTVPIGMPQVLALGVLGSVVLWAEELRKLLHRRSLRGPR